MLEHRRIYFHYSLIQFEVLKFPVKYDVTLGGGVLAKRDGVWRGGGGENGRFLRDVILQRPPMFIMETCFPHRD